MLGASGKEGKASPVFSAHACAPPSVSPSNNQAGQVHPDRLGFITASFQSQAVKQKPITSSPGGTTPKDAARLSLWVQKMKEKHGPKIGSASAYKE